MSVTKAMRPERSEDAAPPAKPRKASDIVDAALAEFLARDDVRPGTKLPTERALADRLKVPRSAVRVAMSRLEVKKRVNRVTGSGTYVAEPETRETPDARDASPFEIMETRILIEPCLASPVVARANSADLATIRRAMEEAAAALDFAAFEHWDGMFHQAIADATHNQVLIEVYRTITASREHAEWGEMKRNSITEERRRHYVAEHAEIMAALQARNTARAEAAIRSHLQTVSHNLLGIGGGIAAG